MNSSEEILRAVNLGLPFKVGMVEMPADQFATFSNDVLIIGAKVKSRFVNDIYNGYNPLNGFALDQTYNQQYYDNDSKINSHPTQPITANLSATASINAANGYIQNSYNEGFLIPRELWAVNWLLYRNTKFNNDQGAIMYVFFAYVSEEEPTSVLAAQIP